MPTLPKILSFLSLFPFYLFLFFAPFYFLPPIFSNFYFKREAILIAASLLLTFVWLLSLFVTRQITLASTNFNLLLLFAFLAFGLSLLFSTNKLVSVFELSSWVYPALLLIIFVFFNSNFFLRVKLKFLTALFTFSLLLLTLIWLLTAASALRNWLNQTYQVSLPTPQILPLPAAWSIALDSIKEKPLWGAGPGLYPQTALRFRPVFLNQTTNWDLLFTRSFWPFFESLTTLGLVNFLLLILILIWSILNRKGPRQTIDLTLAQSKIILTLGTVSLGLVAFFCARLVLAEIYHQKALTLLASGQAVREASPFLTRALNFNFYAPNSHRTLANLSFGLANALSAQKPAAERTQAEQQDILNLLQQAINEIRYLTENLNPQDFRNWQIRGQIYLQLIGAAAGADSWTIDAYLQTVNLSPSNPLLRVELGGAYFGLAINPNFNLSEETKKTYLELAVEQFRTAIRLKPDWANGYYNLAFAFKAQGKFDAALATLRQAQIFLPADSPDQETIKKDLEVFQTPTPTPTPAALPKISPLPTLKALPSPTPR